MNDLLFLFLLIINAIIIIAVLYRAWYRRWKAYDPTWLVHIAEKYTDQYPWLPTALKQCSRASIESNAYTRFVSSRNYNKPGSQWQFKENIGLEDDVYGELILDILEGNRIGGVEFISRLPKG